MFVFGVKRKRKIFYTTRSVCVGRKTKSNGKSFPLTIKYEGLKCKIDYTSILPSNHFQRKKKNPNLERKRIAHRRRERGRSPELEINSTAVWSMPFITDQAKLNSTADLPFFSRPPFATHVTDLPFFSLPMSSKPPQVERPTVT